MSISPRDQLLELCIAGQVRDWLGNTFLKLCSHHVHNHCGLFMSSVLRIPMILRSFTAK